MAGRTLTGRDRLLIWFGAFGGAAAWTLQLVLGYGLEESLCELGHTETKGPIVVVSLVAAAVSAGAALAAFTIWRSAGRKRRDPRGRVRFLALVGMFTGVFFLVLIALGGLQLLSLDSCAQG